MGDHIGADLAGLEYFAVKMQFVLLKLHRQHLDEERGKVSPSQVVEGTQLDFLERGVGVDVLVWSDIDLEGGSKHSHMHDYVTLDHLDAL